MDIRLPRFQDSKCLAMTACGEVRCEDPRALALLKKERTWVAKYRVSSGIAFLRLMTGPKSPRHLHVDCALKAYFPKGRTPKANHTLSEILTTISVFAGSRVDLNLIAEFEAKTENLPETGLIRSLAIQHSAGEVSIRLTGGNFAISGSPVEGIRWALRDNDKTVRIHVKAQKEGTIDEDYLVRLMEWIEEQYLLFVEGKRRRENT